jgi:hypothetical protein
MKWALLGPRLAGHILLEWQQQHLCGFLLRLKSLKRYSEARISELGSAAPALGIFYILFICFTSSLVIAPAWAITAAHI